MRITLMSLALVTLAGCSWERMAHHSPYDLNYDGTLDAVCPGTAYDTNDYHHYSWRSKASTECNELVFGDRAG
jgi:hypothetical protein